MISLMLPIAIGLISSVAVFFGGLTVKPEQLVSLVFPYVKKKEESQGTIHIFKSKSSTLDIFGCEVSSPGVRVFFSIVLIIAFCTTYVFFSSFTEVSYKYNPYDSFDCFFTSNDSMVELSPEEALVLEESVLCFRLNFNVSRAIGEASGMLAFLWIFSSIMAWISVRIKQQSHAEYCQYIFLIIIFYFFATVLSISLIITGALAFAHQFTDLLNSVEIMSCGLILALQLIPLIVSDVNFIKKPIGNFKVAFYSGKGPS